MAFAEELSNLAGLTALCIALIIVLKIASFTIEKERKKRLLKVTVQAAKKRKDKA